jgi:cysteine desulfurase
VLISLMHVNNEIGSIHDLQALGKLIKEASNAFFHVDAAQSVGKYPLSMDNSPIDLLTFSAHKFFGLKGSGSLILRKRIELPPLLQGGGQEDGFRSGTADAAKAAAQAKALRLSLEKREETYLTVTDFKKTIIDAISKVPDTALNGTVEGSSPFIINFSIAGVRPETLLQALAEKELYISTVSACSTRKTTESSVVLALTGSHERAGTSIRISLSALTTQGEVDTLCSTLPPLVKSLRFKRK